MKNLIQEVATEMRLSPSQVEAVYKSVFFGVKDALEKKSNINLTYLGKFVFNIKRATWLEQYKTSGQSSEGTIKN